MIQAEPLEDQLVEWIRDFKPDKRLTNLIVKTIEADRPKRDPSKARLGELLGQLTRLQDLYVLGDLPKAQYVMRRQAIEEKLQRLGAPADPAINRAKEMLGDFSRFWDIETEAAERRRLLLSLFEQVWEQDGRIVAVQPRDDFLPYFRAASRCRRPRGAESWSDGGRSRVCCLGDRDSALTLGDAGHLTGRGQPSRRRSICSTSWPSSAFAASLSISSSVMTTPLAVLPWSPTADGISTFAISRSMRRLCELKATPRSARGRPGPRQSARPSAHRRLVLCHVAASRWPRERCRRERRRSACCHQGVGGCARAAPEESLPSPEATDRHPRRQTQLAEPRAPTPQALRSASVPPAQV
jgi:hypothetical protein